MATTRLIFYDAGEWTRAEWAVTLLNLRCINSFTSYNNGYGTPTLQDGTMFSEFYSPGVVNSILGNGTDYDSFRRPLEGTPHGAIHQAIAGDMAPAYSPNVSGSTRVLLHATRKVTLLTISAR